MSTKNHRLCGGTAAEPIEIVYGAAFGRLPTVTRVLEILDGRVQVLGVIKPKRTPFLDAVRVHPNTQIIEVTPENRDEVINVIEYLARFW